MNPNFKTFIEYFKVTPKEIENGGGEGAVCRECGGKPHRLKWCEVLDIHCNCCIECTDNCGKGRYWGIHAPRKDAKWIKQKR